MSANKAAAWGLVYVALAGAAGFVTDWGRGMRPVVPVPKPAAAAPLDYPIQPEFSLPPLGQGFAETTARPAFTPVRRAPPPPEPPKPAMKKGQFILLGVLLTVDKNIALLREVAGGKLHRVEQGKEINGITLAGVQPERIILAQYDETEELTLKIQPMPKSPAKTKEDSVKQSNAESAQQQVPLKETMAGKFSARVDQRRRERLERKPVERQSEEKGAGQDSNSNTQKMLLGPRPPKL